MIYFNWPLEKHLPGILSSHALLRCGVHWKIHSRLSTILEATRIMTAACKGLIEALVTVIRRRKRHIDTFVNVRVAKVLHLSGQQITCHSIHLKYLKPLAVRIFHAFPKIVC